MSFMDKAPAKVPSKVPSKSPAFTLSTTTSRQLLLTTSPHPSLTRRTGPSYFTQPYTSDHGGSNATLPYLTLRSAPLYSFSILAHRSAEEATTSNLFSPLSHLLSGFTTSLTRTTCSTAISRAPATNHAHGHTEKQATLHTARAYERLLQTRASHRIASHIAEQSPNRTPSITRRQHGRQEGSRREQQKGCRERP